SQKPSRFNKRKEKTAMLKKLPQKLILTSFSLMLLAEKALGSEVTKELKTLAEDANSLVMGPGGSLFVGAASIMGFYKAQQAGHMATALGCLGVGFLCLLHLG